MALAAPEPVTKSEPSEREAWAEGQGEGDRAEAPAAAPVAAREDVMRPESHEELTPDAEERGQRTDKGAERADY